MTDRHAPWIAALWAVGVAALAAALLWTAATMPDGPHARPLPSHLGQTADLHRRDSRFAFAQVAVFRAARPVGCLPPPQNAPTARTPDRVGVRAALGGSALLVGVPRLP